MQIDTDDLVSVTELGRGLSRYINQVSDESRRFVILNSNVATAALIGMDDLERLLSLDAAANQAATSSGRNLTELPSLTDLEARAGSSAIGNSEQGEPIYWSMTAHSLVVGKFGAGLAEFVSAAIAGAMPDPETPTEMVVATNEPVVALHHSREAPLPLAVELGLDSSAGRRRFTEILNGVVSDRQDLLRDHKVATIAAYRSRPDQQEPTPNLVLFIVDSGGILDDDQGPNAELFRLLGVILERGDALGIHLWLATSQRPNHRSWIELAGLFADRIVLPRGVRDRAASRELIGTDAAATSTIPPGCGIRRADDTVEVIAIRAPADDIGAELAGTGHLESWWPRLTAPITFADVLVDEAAPSTSPLELPIGMSDLPWEPYILRPEGEATHIYISGRPGSGRTTAIEAIIASAAQAYEPQQCAFAIIDTATEPGEITGLPNVIGYTNHRADPDEASRFVGELQRLAEVRRKAFAANRHTSLAQYLASRSSAEDQPQDPYGHFFLVVDGLDNYLNSHWGAAPTFADILRDDVNLGIHVIASATQLPTKLATLFGKTIQFATDDMVRVAENSRHRLRARTIPDGQPGRCIDMNTGRAARIALPVTEGPTDEGALKRLVETLQRGGKPLPQLQPVPQMLDANQFWNRAGKQQQRPPANSTRRAAMDTPLPLGIKIDDDTLAEVCDYNSPHLLIAGDQGSGKTATLRAVIAAIRRRYSSDGNGAPEAKIAILARWGELMDDRAALKQDGYLLADAGDRDKACEFAKNVAQIIDERVPKDTDALTASMVRDRLWYDGPEVFVVIDDLQFFHGNGMVSTLEPFMYSLDRRNDLGLHIIATTPAREFATARLANKMYRALEGASTSTLLLRGSHADGTIWPGTGIRFANRPPGRGLLVGPYAADSGVIQVPWHPPAS